MLYLFTHHNISAYPEVQCTLYHAPAAQRPQTWSQTWSRRWLHERSCQGCRNDPRNGRLNYHLNDGIDVTSCFTSKATNATESIAHCIATVVNSLSNNLSDYLRVKSTRFITAEQFSTDRPSRFHVINSPHTPAHQLCPTNHHDHTLHLCSRNNAHIYTYWNESPWTNSCKAMYQDTAFNAFINEILIDAEHKEHRWSY